MKKKVIIILCTLILVFLTASSITFLYINSKVSKMHTVKISKTAKDLGIKQEVMKDKHITEEDYTNILLLGTDTREKDTDRGRSDVMMILTIDRKHQKVKMTSIMRDSLVTINNGSPKQDKITHAYAFGGAPLSIKTVNENYEMNIKDYVKVDFFGLEKIIDYAGGVDINVSAAEVPQINASVNEVAGIEKKTPNRITKSGIQHLNGSQAVGYARIRYVGNSDFQRTQRQRDVLTQVVQELVKKDKSKIGEMADNILPYLETSLDKSTVYKLSLYLATNKPKAIEQLRLPIDGTNHDLDTTGVYYLGWDKPENIQALHKFITEE